MLETSKGRRKDNAQFSKRGCWSELIGFIGNQADWVFNDEAFLCQADDGECMA
jgi:hypothetical protein